MTYLDVLQRLLEGERHASTDDQQIDLEKTVLIFQSNRPTALPYLVQHVVDELDLVGNLGTTEDGQEWPLGALQRLREELEFFFDEETCSPLGQFHADHTRVCAMRRAERIIHIHIAKFS